MIKRALITTPEVVAKEFEKQKKLNNHIPLVATSGGFDPLHSGHIRCIYGSSLLKGDGLLVVIVNADSFLMHKKGFVFMTLEERMELISHIVGVDYVVPWDDDTHTVTNAVKIIKPNIFSKGGDKSVENVPEVDVCVGIGCSVVYGIGGCEKIQSSCDLISKAIEKRK